ncbi:MAG: peptidoglycan DD-metalloendopeptidase family protein [Candidatus Krumholzibacteria bacterium]|nr:peptidoglycan DD-metalloendopeptidase family protein [Candidatus Krumholzibacteria bacterium]
MRRVKVILILMVLMMGAVLPAVGQDQPVQDQPVEDQPVQEQPVIITSKQAKGKDLLKKSIEENSTNLIRLRGQIDDRKQRIKNLDREEAEAKRGHEEIQKEIELSRQLVGDMVQHEIILQERSKLLTAELEKRGDTFATRKETLAKSLRAMYIRSQRSDLEMVMTSGSFSEFLTGVKVGRTLARLEAGMLEEVQTEGQILRREQRQLNSALAEIWQTREEQNQQNDRLEDLMAEEMGALRDLETERKGLKNELLTMGNNEQKLSYVLTDLEQVRVERSAQQTTAGNSLAKLAGNLEWPVRGKLIRGFGRSVHPKFKTVTLNNGFNIAAPAGSPVAAVADGSVEYSDHLPGFGQCVILDHGAGYYTLYAHLDGVFVVKGEKIARGQVIAEVGRPAPGDDPQLYFEVRQGRTPLDPADWLRSR